MESSAFLALLLQFVRDRLLATLAETSPLFESFTPLERIALASSFQFLEVEAKVRLVDEGTRSPGLFILLAGEAAVVSGSSPIAHIQGGDVFGEISLISGGVSQATVVTLAKSFVLFLPREAFSELIMTHPQVLEYVGQIADVRQRAIGRLTLL